MAWVDIVLMLALIEFFVFALYVGRARGAHGIKAPAMAGHPVVERWLRVQGNTLEMLMLFVPGLWAAAHYWKPEYMAAVGSLFIVGRALYAFGYVSDPAKRSAGFFLSLLPAAFLVLAALFGAVRTLL
jgi:glutathione S-transferase